MGIGEDAGRVSTVMPGAWRSATLEHGARIEHSMGNLSIPREAFIAALRMGDEG